MVLPVSGTLFDKRFRVRRPERQCRRPDPRTLFAVPFDQSRLEVKGTPTAVLDEVAYSEAYGSAKIDFSRTGIVVYRESRTGAGLVTMQWVDESGNTIPVLPVPGNYLSPALSADGNRLAFTLGGDIWVYDLKHPERAQRRAWVVEHPEQ